MNSEKAFIFAIIALGTAGSAMLAAGGRLEQRPDDATQAAVNAENAMTGSAPGEPRSVPAHDTRFRVPGM